MTKFEKPETPFPRAWLSYIGVKLVLLGLALFIALRLLGWI